jgi:hypothetical protein
MCRSAYSLDQFPILQQRPLILDIITSRPCLDLVSKPLQLLDLTLEVIFLLLLLGSICGLFDLLVDRLEFCNAFGDLLEAFIDFLLELPLRHRRWRRGVIAVVGLVLNSWCRVHGSGCEYRIFGPMRGAMTDTGRVEDADVGTRNFTRSPVWRVNIVSARSFGEVEAASAFEVRAFWIGSLTTDPWWHCLQDAALKPGECLFKVPLNTSQSNIDPNLCQLMVHKVWFSLNY